MTDKWLSGNVILSVYKNEGVPVMSERGPTESDTENPAIDFTKLHMDGLVKGHTVNSDC